MIMSDLQGQIWMDGSFCDWKEAKIHILTHTMHYGSGVFEGVRAYETHSGPAIFRLKEHTDRLFYSAKRMGMDVPYSINEIIEATKQIVKIQKVQNGYIRPIIWRGSEMMQISAQKNKITLIEIRAGGDTPTRKSTDGRLISLSPSPSFHV